MVVGSAAEVMRSAHVGTRSIVGCNEPRVIPYLIDSHVNMIRGGLTIGLASFLATTEALWLWARSAPPISRRT